MLDCVGFSSSKTGREEKLAGLLYVCLTNFHPEFNCQGGLQKIQESGNILAVRKDELGEEMDWGHIHVINSRKLFSSSSF